MYIIMLNHNYCVYKPFVLRIISHSTIYVYIVLYVLWAEPAVTVLREIRKKTRVVSRAHDRFNRFLYSRDGSL